MNDPQVTAPVSCESPPMENPYLLPDLPDGWELTSLKNRRDGLWLRGGLATYDALLECGNREAAGFGLSPRAAVLEAIREIKNDET